MTMPPDIARTVASSLLGVTGRARLSGAAGILNTRVGQFAVSTHFRVSALPVEESRGIG
tara:strand:+ start:750 stop:926 length:177 start_codon:yes stop_codon:yes gene_type:complete